MPLLPIQILIVAFAVFAAARAVSQFRAGRLRIAMLALWLLLWAALAAIGVLPQSASAVAAFLGVGRGVDLVMYVSLGVLFFLIFRLYVKHEEQEREITRLVREVALKDLKN